MLIRPHDAPIDSEREWRDLVTAHPFGHLIAPGKDREFPVVVPTHIHFDGDLTIRLHLARPNPVWPALRENPRCLFLVTAAVAYVPTSWEAEPGTPAELSMPSSSSTAPNQTPCGSRSSTATSGGTHPATPTHSPTCSDATHRQRPPNSRASSAAPGM